MHTHIYIYMYIHYFYIRAYIIYALLCIHVLYRYNKCMVICIIIRWKEDGEKWTYLSGIDEVEFREANNGFTCKCKTGLVKDDY